MKNDAVRGSALRSWVPRVAGRQLLRQRRPLLLVLAVAVLASTAVTSVGLLVAATEESAVRTSLGALPSSDTSMSVEVLQPTVGLSEVTTRISRAIRSLLGASVSATPSVFAFSAPDPIEQQHGPASLQSPLSPFTGLAYFGELADVRDHVKLLSGTLPTKAPSASAPTVEVALPAAAATQLGFMVGSRFSFSGADRPVTIVVTGIYSLPLPDSEYWSQDPLHSAGISTSFTLPTGGDQAPTDAFGPLLVAPGSLDAIGVRADRVEIDYSPSFQKTDTANLGPLVARLSNADSDVPADAGDIAAQVSYSGDAGVQLEQIGAELVVTRSTVVVVTLLLLVLSIASLIQAARLFNDARSGDRELMRARGASRSQLLRIALLEAGAVGFVTALLSAPLARLAYLVIAAQPAMRSAHVPSDSGLPISAWLTAIALGALFIVVLILSLLGRSGSFVSAEQNNSRQRRVSGILRSGLDLGAVALAAVAFWQLNIYRGPVGAGSTLSVDPVLVAAPALVLLAGALLAARLFPLLTRLVDVLGSHSNGALFRLASWEIGRRFQRATAVVLLLTLALAVGAFSQTFLATWRQSQVDQANYAVGPTVRVPAVASEEGAQRSLLTQGASGTPQPVIRRVADVDQDGQDGEETDAVVLGLTPGARAMLTRGQLASEGGSAITSRLHGSTEPVTGMVLPGNPSGISAVAQVGDVANPLPGVSADIRAVIQDGAGLLSTVDLGSIPVDGQPKAVEGTFTGLPHGAHRALPLRFVGLQFSVFLSNQATYQPNRSVQTRFLFGHLASVEPASDASASANLTAPSTGIAWHADSTGADGASALPVNASGWQLGLSVIVPANVQANPATYSDTAWATPDQIPVVVSGSLAHALDITTGAVLVLNIGNASVGIHVAGTTPLVPGAVDGSLLTPSSASGADSSDSNAVIMDQSSLQRALIDEGETGPMVDEWWVTVPAVTAQAYVNAHPAPSGAQPARSAVVLARQLQQDPLRVATQAALWLAVAAAAVLAAIGFAVHSASTIAARRIELAQLRAIGLSRRRLVALIAAESLMLSSLGVLFGVAVGLALGWLAGPLIALSPNGSPAVPPVRVIVPWLQLVLLVLVMVVVVIAVVVAVSRGQRTANPANILREADNR